MRNLRYQTTLPFLWASYQKNRHIRIKRKMEDKLPFYPSGQTAENFQPSIFTKGKSWRPILGQEAEMHFLLFFFPWHSSYYSCLLKYLLFHPIVESSSFPLISRKDLYKAQHQYEKKQCGDRSKKCAYVGSISRPRWLRQCAGQWEFRRLERERGPNPHIKPIASWEPEGDSKTDSLHKSHDLNTVMPSWKTQYMLAHANRFLGGRNRKEVESENFYFWPCHSLKTFPISYSVEYNTSYAYTINQEGISREVSLWPDAAIAMGLDRERKKRW